MDDEHPYLTCEICIETSFPFFLHVTEKNLRKSAPYPTHVQSPRIPAVRGRASGRRTCAYEYTTCSPWYCGSDEQRSGTHCVDRNFRSSVLECQTAGRKANPQPRSAR